MRNNASEILEKIIAKAENTAPLAARSNVLPYGGAGERWRPAPFDGNSWWTGGFWPGALWLLYAVSGKSAFLEEARRAEALLTAELRAFRLLNHDVGFMYLLSCGADDKLTGDAQARTDCLHAASLLMGRFNPAGFIRAWNEPERVGYAIIDCLMNLSLLFWASAETGDPRFANVARVHADTTLSQFVRPDGSVSHIVEFDPATGARVREHAGQGYALGSAWSRGQAWGLYGFAMAYQNTSDARYLEASRRIADFFVAHQHRRGLRRQRPFDAGQADRRGPLARGRRTAARRADRPLLRPVARALRRAHPLHRQLSGRRRGPAHQHRLRRLLPDRGAIEGVGQGP